MSLWIILAIVAAICLMNRRSGERWDSRQRHRTRPDARDREIDRLNARVSTLEEILLDRDRRLRDQFRGL